MPQATEHRDDENVDEPARAHRARGHQPVVPGEQHAAHRGEGSGHRVGRHAVRGHVEAERVHAARIVADALEGDPEGRAQQVDHGEVARQRTDQGQVVEGRGIAPGDARQGRREHLLLALEAVEDGVVLQGQVVERHADRQGDHDHVDPLGADREPADAGRGQHGDDDPDDHRQPPRPAQSDAVRGRGAEDRHHVPREAGDRHLRERDHAAGAGQEREGQRDEAEGQGLGADLVGEERRGEPGIGDQEREHDEMVRAHGVSDPGTARSRRVAHGSGRAPGRRPQPSRLEIHRPAPVGRAHAGRPRMPRGRKASTSTRIAKVKTTL